MSPPVSTRHWRKKKPLWRDVILHGPAECNASRQRIVVLGLKGKKEDLFLNVVSEEHALNVSEAYPSIDPKKPDASSSMCNFCGLHSSHLNKPLFSYFHPHPSSSCKEFRSLASRSRVWEVQIGTSMKCPIQGTQQLSLRRKACKTDPQPLAALHKTTPILPCSTLHTRKWEESNLRSSSSASLHFYFCSNETSVGVRYYTTRETAKSPLLPNLRPYVVLLTCLSYSEETCQSVVSGGRERYFNNWRPH